MEITSMRCKLCNKSNLYSKSKFRHCWINNHCARCHYLGKTGSGRKYVHLVNTHQ